MSQQTGSYNRSNEIGTRPAEQGPSAYAYGNQVNHNSGLGMGWEGGFGINSGLLGEKDGWNAQSSLLSANGFLGARSQKEADGSFSAWHGAGAEGKVAEVSAGYGSPGEGWFAQAHGEALTAHARAEFNEQRGANASVGADLVAGDVSFGHLSKDSGHDQTAKFGVSAGVGMGGGVHWADEDGDGIREIGINGSIALGPGISFDLRSETLGQGYKWLEDNVPGAWDASTEWAGNAWDTSTDAIGGAWNSTTDAVAGGWNATTDAVAGGWNAATDTVAGGWNTATDAVGSGWNSATDAVAGGWSSATDTIGSGLSSAGGAVASFFSGW